MPENQLFERIEKIKMPIRILIFVAAVAVLICGFSFALFIPKKGEINRLNASIEDLDRRLNKIKLTVSKKKETDEKMALIATQFEDALKQLPESKEIPSLLKTITQLGSDSQLEFRLFTPQNERPQDFYVEIPVAIEVSGNFHNVAVFFDKIGRMERIVNILDVSMQPIKEYATDLVTKCTAITYRFKGQVDADESKGKKKKK